MDHSDPDEAPRALAHVGSKLKGAREAAQLSLADIAERTRITTRHLESIEAGRLGDLPGSTYAVGFVRTYARTLGMDEASIVEQARHEMGWQGPRAATNPDYVPTDPRRLPPSLLAWTAGVLLLLLVGGYFLFRSGMEPAPDAIAVTAADQAVAAGNASSGSIGGAPVATQPSAAASASSAAAPGGQVVLTATAPVWLRVYDAGRTRLFEKEMAAGERYLVPADANGPMVLTGKPDAIAVTVGGRPVPPLGSGERTIADVGISAAALAARSSGPPSPAEARTMPPAPALLPAGR